MNTLTISTYKSDNITPSGETIIISEKEIGKCRGCLRCRILKQCISYKDDAQECIPLLLAADHLDIYLQPASTIQLLMDRVLYALAGQGEGKTFTFHIEDGTEAEYLRNLLTWCKYKETLPPPSL